ncbi:hypothetical protein [Streptomyces prasinopilosus]|uniref:hypothetical protein n=1 Tax=Streptomyces prasinopilosus TaxID=67344 RepID=UPI0006EBD369|nr:hypothetical protein [Streptomyces prasinopilosus]
MTTFRDVLIRRQMRNLRQALASLHGVTRHDDDFPAVRITFTDPETGEALDSLSLRLLAFTELVDAARARSTDLVREQLRHQTAQSQPPAAPVLRMVPTDSFPTTTTESRT